MISKYGVEHASQNQEIQLKRNLSGGLGLLYLIKKQKK